MVKTKKMDATKCLNICFYLPFVDPSDSDVTYGSPLLRQMPETFTRSVRGGCGAGNNSRHIWADCLTLSDISTAVTLLDAEVAQFEGRLFG